MTALPATNETWLIDLEQQTPNLPLVGWLHTTGLNLVPLVVGHPGPLVTGEAFLLHTGQVYDPAVSEMFEDEDSWGQTVVDYTNYRPGSPLPAFAVPTQTKTVSTNDVTSPIVRTQPQPKDPAPAGELVWGTKTYKSKSFWMFMPQKGEGYLMVVEAEKPVPKNAVKITRDDFYAKRKAGMVERAGVPGDEPELPLTPLPAEEDDDDLV